MEPHRAERGRRWRPSGRLDLETDHGPMQLVQIAGAVVGRIGPCHDVGADVAKTERIGIIRVGSRVDLHLPEGIDPTDEVGDRVPGAVSPISPVEEP